MDKNQNSKEKVLTEEEIFRAAHSVCTPCGQRIKPVFEWDKEQNRAFKTGEVDLQEQANAAAVGSGVYGIIDRIARGASVTLPSVSEGQFADISQVDLTAEAALKASNKSVLVSSDKTQDIDDDKLAQALKDIESLKSLLAEKKEDK